MYLVLNISEVANREKNNMLSSYVRLLLTSPRLQG